MIKRLFWLIAGVVLAAVGMNFIRKKIEENPQQFSTDMLVEKFIEIFDSVKEFVQGIWQSYSGGETLNDHELEKIFDIKTDFDPEFDTAIKPSDISLN